MSRVERQAIDWAGMIIEPITRTPYGVTAHILDARKAGYAAGFRDGRNEAATLFEGSWANARYQGMGIREALQVIGLDMRLLGEEEEVEAHE